MHTLCVWACCSLPGWRWGAHTQLPQDGLEIQQDFTSRHCTAPAGTQYGGATSVCCGGPVLAEGRAPTVEIGPGDPGPSPLFPRHCFS